MKSFRGNGLLEVDGGFAPCLEKRGSESLMHAKGPGEYRKALPSPLQQRGLEALLVMTAESIFKALSALWLHGLGPTI